MADSYGVLPTFTHGQVLSAGFHLNGLQRYVQGLHDEATGTRMPFSGYITNNYEAAGFFGVLRHAYNSFYYNVTVTTGGSSVLIKINNVTKATLNGAGNFTATIDITSMGLTVGEFYDVTVTGTNVFFIVRLLGETATTSFPTLTTFNDGTTPTAAQWQALSTYAAALSASLSPLVALGTYDGGAAKSEIGTQIVTPWTGSMNHRGQYLAYKFWLQKPFNDASGGGPSWIDGYLNINGVDVLRRRVGKVVSPVPTGIDFAQVDRANREWSGSLDLNVYPGSLVTGDDYSISFRVEDSTFWDDSNDSELRFLAETPGAGSTIPAWSAWRTWAQGNYVWGSTNPAGNPKLMRTIRGNLLALGAVVPYVFSPVARKRSTRGKLFGVRSRRYIRFRCEEDDDPKIFWSYRGKDQVGSLEAAVDEWKVVDLDSFEGLFLGTTYHLEGVLYGFEDDNL